ncbi:unnamed protein product [Chrysodeixis includens]|uniref:CHK kinase-like domain-containing protein n=1 Tax=Chrysodeixis includens TaxID=689277 RepID=A0A9P0BQR9_CHRIL|nr:unnamed protein product [Chrysodeixis includens]
MSDAEIELRKVLENVTEKLQYKDAEVSIKDLNSGGANYTSTLYSATITSPGREPLKLFAKVASASEMLRQAIPLDHFYRTEQMVYEHLVDVFEKIQDKYNVSPEHRYVFPKFFGAQSTYGKESVVMEDLTEGGYSTYSRFKCLDFEHAAAAVECLARFHALSFAFQHEDPEGFAKVAEKVKHVKQPATPDMKSTFMKMVASAVEATRNEHKEKMLKFFDEMYLDEFDKFRRPLSTTVLCHGDYRASNMLFKRQNGRIQPIVVDYQTVHTGCPAVDILYLEFLGTDEEFRREHHHELVERYFQEFTAALHRLGLDVDQVYPRETFDKELQEMLGPALRTCSVVLPLVLVEASQAPSFGAVSSMDSFALSPTEHFAERFGGVVSDCVRWGVL